MLSFSLESILFVTKESVSVTSVIGVIGCNTKDDEPALFGTMDKAVLSSGVTEDALVSATFVTESVVFVEIIVVGLEYEVVGFANTSAGGLAETLPLDRMGVTCSTST